MKTNVINGNNNKGIIPYLTKGNKQPTLFRSVNYILPRYFANSEQFKTKFISEQHQKIYVYYVNIL